jgi:hypothetical protein
MVSPPSPRSRLPSHSTSIPPAPLSLSCPLLPLPFQPVPVLSSTASRIHSLSLFHVDYAPPHSIPRLPPLAHAVSTQHNSSARAPSATSFLQQCQHGQHFHRPEHERSRSLVAHAAKGEEGWRRSRRQSQGSFEPRPALVLGFRSLGKGVREGIHGEDPLVLGDGGKRMLRLATREGRSLGVRCRPTPRLASWPFEVFLRPISSPNQHQLTCILHPSVQSSSHSESQPVKPSTASPTASFVSASEPSSFVAASTTTPKPSRRQKRTKSIDLLSTAPLSPQDLPSAASLFALPQVPSPPSTSIPLINSNAINSNAQRTPSSSAKSRRNRTKSDKTGFSTVEAQAIPSPTTTRKSSYPSTPTGSLPHSNEDHLSHSAPSESSFMLPPTQPALGANEGGTGRKNKRGGKARKREGKGGGGSDEVFVVDEEEGKVWDMPEGSECKKAGQQQLTVRIVDRPLFSLPNILPQIFSHPTSSSFPLRDTHYFGRNSGSRPSSQTPLTRSPITRSTTDPLPERKPPNLTSPKRPPSPPSVLLPPMPTSLPSIPPRGRHPATTVKPTLRPLHIIAKHPP